MPKVGLTRYLKSILLADLLQRDSLGKKAGSLVLRKDSLVEKVFFNNGVIVGSATNDPTGYLGQLRISESIISVEQIKDAIDEQ